MINTKKTSFIFVIVILISQLSCQAATQLIATEPASTPTIETVAPPTVDATDTPSTGQQFSDDEIKAGIQNALNIYADAYNTNDPALLAEMVDKENKPFFRIVTSRFNTTQESYLGGKITYEFNLLDIQRREFGFVLAHIESQSGALTDWIFRFAEDRWVLSEPTVEQVGEPVTTETEYFIFTTYPWADDVNPKIMDMMETARNDVEKILGKVPAEKANVKILPIYGLRPYNSMSAVALYMQGEGVFKDIIEVYTPNSFAFGSYYPDTGWDGELQTNLTHEYTHMTHTRSFDRAGRLSDWMLEGLAEYVSAPEYIIVSACAAYKSGTFIPILDESGAVYKQDLMHLTVLDNDIRLGYDYAMSLVKFTVDNYGGTDGFWKLANALDETGDFKKALQSAYGISYEQYDKEWQTWLKKQC